MFTIGWTGDAVAASLTMVLQLMSTPHGRRIPKYYQTSCFCPATRLAGRKGSCLAVVEDIARKPKGWALGLKAPARLSLKAFRFRRLVNCLQLKAHIGVNLLHWICNRIERMTAFRRPLSRLNLGDHVSANAVRPMHTCKVMVL
jgi:hypothetical protein